jgi:hypothetical protein
MALGILDRRAALNDCSWNFSTIGVNVLPIANSNHVKVSHGIVDTVSSAATRSPDTPATARCHNSALHKYSSGNR